MNTKVQALALPALLQDNFSISSIYDLLGLKARLSPVIVVFLGLASEFMGRDFKRPAVKDSSEWPSKYSKVFIEQVLTEAIGVIVEEGKLLGEDVHDFELGEVIDFSILPAGNPVAGCSIEEVAEKDDGAACWRRMLSLMAAAIV
ncbi:hypothetical protein Droror1_Dr00017702 [Drosera rotundifolia]